MYILVHFFRFGVKKKSFGLGSGIVKVHQNRCLDFIKINAFLVGTAAVAVEAVVVFVSEKLPDYYFPSSTV